MTAVDYLLSEFQEILKDYGGLYEGFLKLFDKAKELEQMQKYNFAIEFLYLIKKYEKENGSRICDDDRSSKELLEIFIKEKNNK